MRLLIGACFLKSREVRVLSTHGLNKQLDAQNDIGYVAKFSSSRKLQRFHRFEPYLVEVISARHQVRYGVFKAVAGEDNVA